MGLADSSTLPRWHLICALEDILPDTGVAALIEERAVAVFRVGEQVYAIDNIDPFSAASVLSRGLVCSIGQRLAVASPIYKQHFDLATGECLEDATRSIHAYAAKVEKGQVLVAR